MGTWKHPGNQQLKAQLVGSQIVATNPTCQQTLPATIQVTMTHPHIVATIDNQCFPLLLYQPGFCQNIGSVEISTMKTYDGFRPSQHFLLFPSFGKGTSS